MPWVAFGMLVLVLAGCGSDESASPAKSPLRTCVAAAPGYSICGKNRTGGTGPSKIRHGDTVVAGPVEDLGRWRKVFVAPGGETLLAEWSGACEIPTAYLISAEGGKPRALTDYSRGSAISLALGWQGSKARVRLPVGQAPDLEPGIYLVDPATMAKTLVRPLQRQHAC